MSQADIFHVHISEEDVRKVIDLPKKDENIFYLFEGEAQSISHISKKNLPLPIKVWDIIRIHILDKLGEERIYDFLVTKITPDRYIVHNISTKNFPEIYFPYLGKKFPYTRFDTYFRQLHQEQEFPVDEVEIKLHDFWGLTDLGTYRLSSIHPSIN